MDKLESEMEAMNTRKKKLDRDACFAFNFIIYFQKSPIFHLTLQNLFI